MLFFRQSNATPTVLTDYRHLWLTRMMLACILCGVLLPIAHADYWTMDQCQQILDQTLRLELKPDLTALTPGEQEAVPLLIEAGQLFHELYLEQRHHQALECRSQISNVADDDHRSALLDVFYLSKGPIATTLDNQRTAIGPVDDEYPGKNVYPLGVAKDELDRVLSQDAQLRSQLLQLRSVVRRADDANRQADRETLDKHPVLRTLHPNFEASMAVSKDYYSVPYAVAYADKIVKIYELLWAASDAIERDDKVFASYLRNRARDVLSGDYESGDASWVTSTFRNLNAQIGSYETYDDALYGVKAFYSLSLLVRDIPRSRELAERLQDIQAIEDDLPYASHKQVRRNIPVGVYNVVADFGQARGTNTATILPNDANHTRKYGRTILLRYNIMTHPDLFRLSQQRFSAALAREFHEHLTMEGGFQRTLWHEVGHYLGVDQTRDGRELGDALQQYSDVFEEMKADLVSLHAAHKLHADGVHDDLMLRSIQAGGILRVLQTNQPRREQPYQTMQLMQWNFFLENDLLSYDAERQEMSIHYDRYHSVVKSLLQQVLEIQAAGDLRKAEAFIDRYTTWSDDLHEPIAVKLRAAIEYRYRLVTYGTLPAR